MLDTCTERLGLATELVCSTRRRAYDLDFFRFRVQPAIMHDQIYFGFDEQGRVVALWTWAYLAPDVEERIVNAPRSVLHESEWNEGDRLWVLDLIAPYGHAPDVIRFLRRSFFPGQILAKSARAKKNSSVLVKQWSRTAPPPGGTRTAATALRFSLPDESFGPSRSEWLRSKHCDHDSIAQRWLEERRRLGAA